MRINDRDRATSSTLTTTESMGTIEPGREPSPVRALNDLPVIEASYYEIVGEVARGGMGRVVEARDLRLRRDVALKLLLNPGSDHVRFLREAMLTARLQHPSIVAIHEVGRFSSGEPFIAMKLVRGQSLREAIGERQTLERRLELMPAVLSVTEAIAYAHSRGVVHRDVKPSNVLLGSFGETVVIDWGLAKELGTDDPSLDPGGESTHVAAEATKTGRILGTPMYMPPEQALGRSVDERADVYALGALLYHVLAGVGPFEGETAQDVLRQVVAGKPASLTRRVPSVPPDLAEIVSKAMSPEPRHRHRHAGEVAADLRKFQVARVAQLRQRDRQAEIQEFIRVSSGFLALPLFLAFWLVDCVFAPQHKYEFLLVRSAMIPVCVLTSWAVKHRVRSLRAAEWVGLGFAFCNSLTITYLIHRSGGLSSPYYAGLNLVGFGLITFFPLTPRFLVAAVVGIYGPFALLAVLPEDRAHPGAIAVTCSFVAATIIISLVVRYFTQQLRQRELMARMKLEDELRSRDVCSGQRAD